VTLRTRLTLVYGGLLALIFIGLGFGAQAGMSGHFRDEDHLLLVSTAQEFRDDVFFVGTPRVQLPVWPASKKFNPLHNPGLYVEVVGPAGQVMYRSESLGGATLPVSSSLAHEVVDTSRSIFGETTNGGLPLDIYYTDLRTPSQQAYGVIVVAKSDADVRKALDTFRVEVFGGLGLLLLILIGFTWLVVGSALRPIRSLTDLAATIAVQRDFSGRVPVRRSVAELKQLAITFNRMVESLAEAYTTQQRFVGDASHELRNPLTIIQANLHFLEEAPDAPTTDRDAALHTARVEADRMTFLINQLLALSRADSGQDILREPIELDRVIVDGFRRIQSRERSPAAEEQRVHLVMGNLDEFVVIGDDTLLLELVVILLDNAVKYTPPGGQAGVELVVLADDTAELRVYDTGVGVREEDRSRIFERFYRSPATRAMGEGSGLGLSIAKWIVEAHSGSISFEPRQGGGTDFKVRLPGFRLSPMSVRVGAARTTRV
jgi:two-component system OmpR family sensor kinase